MRIGFVPETRNFVGGVFQYTNTMLLSLDRIIEEDTIVLISSNFQMLQELDIQNPHFAHIALRNSHIENWKQKFIDIAGEKLAGNIWLYFSHLLQPRRYGGKMDDIKRRMKLRKFLKDEKIDLIIYSAHSTMSFEVGLPYIIAIHDIQHRLHPEFPEVASYGKWYHREYFFRNAIKHALFVLVDSEIGKEDALRFYNLYGASPEKIKILPMLPAQNCNRKKISDKEKAEIQKQYRLPQNFLFYPAQFWPHKNHINIIKALKLLEKKYKIVAPIVFCGSHNSSIQKSVFKKIQKIAKEINVHKQVKYIGFVPDVDLGTIYSMATALVMPTFFGPSNIPPLEAFSFGCPVITSNIRGIKEQVGDAAILVDPKNVEEIAVAIFRLMTDSSLRNKLVNRGLKKKNEYTSAHYDQKLKEIIKDAKKILKK